LVVSCGGGGTGIGIGIAGRGMFRW
jgi:hypothetical protein